MGKESERRGGEAVEPLDHETMSFFRAVWAKKKAGLQPGAPMREIKLEGDEARAQVE